MVKPHEASVYNTLGKKTAPTLSSLLARDRLASWVRSLETYLAFIQGKGSGSGWDIEAEARLAVQQVRRSDPVVFDVGAGRGDWSASFLKTLGTPARLFLFEPLPSYQEVLSSRDLPGATLIPAAAGDRSQPGVLHAPRSGFPIASLYLRRDSYFRTEEFYQEAVEVITLDDVIEDYGFDYVDFAKIDVEGHELAVLHGASRALESRKIKAIAFEFGSGNINSRSYFHDLWDVLCPSGYHVWRICPGGVLLPVREYYEDLEYFRGVSNYLATVR